MEKNVLIRSYENQSTIFGDTSDEAVLPFIRKKEIHGIMVR